MSSHKSQFCVRLAALIILSIVVAGRTASAEPISLGTLAFDEFIPGATNVFSIVNFTGDPASGGSSLPPDFPVLTPLTFVEATLHLVDAAGIATNVALGDIGMGPLLGANGDPLEALQFAASTYFVSARFTATLLAASFALADGSLFVPNSSSLVVDLLPDGGPYLAPGVVATIAVDGERSSVPEPGLLALVALGALVGSASLRSAARTARARR